MVDLASVRQAIEKRYATEFASSPGAFVYRLASVCPALNEMCAISEGELGDATEGLLCKDLRLGCR